MEHHKTIKLIGPHTAHLLFKIVLVISALILYAIINFHGFLIAIQISIGLYLAVPFCFRFSPTILKNLIFLHNFWWPNHHEEYFQPAFHKMTGARNFYVDPKTGRESKDGVGVWHLLPKSLVMDLGSSSETGDIFSKSLKNTEKPIVVYFHGNMGSRATPHRVDLYKLLQELLDCHVIAFDYCGFGDSSPVVLPSETSAVEDSLAVYKWICDKTTSEDGHGAYPRIFVWGHSLGTSIASRLLSKLEDPKSKLRKKVEKPLKISGLILEAPFTNMAEEFESFPLSKIYSLVPTFVWFFIEPLYLNDVAFETDIYLQELNEIPLLILHAKNDAIVPVELGDKLYRRIRTFRSSREGSAPIEFKVLDGLGTNLAHAFLYTVSQFDGIVKKFVQSV